jgi:catechol 2,3-dioxygenase-like lactoylglutathione lyase family enzyme
MMPMRRDDRATEHSALTAASVSEELLNFPSLGRPVIQIGYTVPSIERAATIWHELTGAGPFFRIGKGPLQLVGARHRGQPAEWSHSTSSGQLGRVMIELTEQHSAWPRSLAEAMGVGHYGLNHVAWLADDLDAETERLESIGIPLILTATAGPQEFRFHDAVEQLGHRIEFYQAISQVLQVYRAVQEAARDWDGRDVLRPLSALRPFMDSVAAGP